VKESGNLVAIDAHVHLHDARDAVRTLEQAAATFSRAAPDAQMGVCMLAERDGFDVFSSLRSRLRGTAEAESLWLDEGRTLLVVAGRQIVSLEGLEILALATAAPIRLEGWPAGEIIAALRAHDALPVLPWGVGKWLGPRGRLVDRLLTQEPDLFLGDNGGRPGFWPVPRFGRGARVLPGSDALPFTGSAFAIGGFGCLVNCDLPADRPAEALRRALRDPEIEAVRYGALAGPLRFAVDQARLRLGKAAA
jgi:hypothetical protein